MEQAWITYLENYKFTVLDLEKILTIPECYNSTKVWEAIIKHQTVDVGFLIRHENRLNTLNIFN